MKVCKTCGIEKDDSEFSKGPIRPNGRRSLRAHCKECRSVVWQKEYRDAHPNFRVLADIIPKTNRDRWMQAKFKLTEAQYFEKLTKQNGVCEICKKPETAIRLGKVRALAIDHDHATGDVRDLLCQKCNTGLGVFNDSPELLIAAAQYLRKHQKNGGK